MYTLPTSLKNTVVILCDICVPLASIRPGVSIFIVENITAVPGVAIWSIKGVFPIILKKLNCIYHV